MKFFLLWDNLIVYGPESKDSLDKLLLDYSYIEVETVNGPQILLSSELEVVSQKDINL